MKTDLRGGVTRVPHQRIAEQAPAKTDKAAPLEKARPTGEPSGDTQVALQSGHEAVSQHVVARGDASASYQSRDVGSSPLGVRFGLGVPDKPKLRRGEAQVLARGPFESGDRLTPAAAELRQATLDVAQQNWDPKSGVSFEVRNERHAKAVGHEAALLAGHSLGLERDELPALATAVTSAARAAGEAFRTAFSDDGQPIAEREADYKKAMSAAGGVAFEALTALSPRAESAVKTASLDDIVALVAKDLGVQTALTGDDVKAILVKEKDGALADDYFKGEVDGLPTGGKSLDDEGMKALGLGVRLANTTWRSGQIHRAAWEGNDSRVNPDKRDVYDTFDLMKARKYEGAGGGDLGIALTAFEIYKDLLQLKKAADA